MKRRLLLPLLLSFVASTAFALAPSPGSGVLGRLVSTNPMSGASVGLLSSSAAVAAVNPASPAETMLPEAELFYAGLVAPAASPSYFGSIIEAGGSLPTAYGVLSGSGRFVSVSSPLDLGTFGELNVSFAKTLFPRLLVGAGADLQLGSGSRFDWGLGLGLGFLSVPGDLGALKDFSWGASIDGIGKPYKPFPLYSSFPPSFTPSVGAGFTLFRSRSTSLKVAGDLSFPSFTDVRFGVGGSLNIGNVGHLRLTTDLDLRELLSHRQAFPLSAAVSTTIALGKSSPVSRIRPSIGLDPVAPGVFGVGAGLSATVGQPDTHPPAISLGVPKVSYISPNGDGVQDNLVVPVTITDEGHIEGYRLVIRSEGGNVVRTIKSPSLAIVAGRTSGLLDRLFYANSGVPVPPKLVWNGKEDNGRTAPDGTYSYTISAWDSYGNRSATTPRTVVVDTRPPTIQLKQPAGSPPIFSPNGDGHKDTISISQTGSTERLWTGRFINSAGKTVRTMVWRDSRPESFVWNGRGDGGRVLPDGVYHYVLSSTDAAGNTATAGIPAIVIDTSRPTVRLDVSTDAISPGTSSPDQSVVYRLEIAERNDVQSWKLNIANNGGKVVRSVHGGAAVAASYTFDGTGSDGMQLPDGAYRAVLSVVYRNGTRSTAHAAIVRIDRVPPTASVTTKYRVFSPVGSGARTDMVFSVIASQERVWRGAVATGGGRVVKSYQWSGRPPSRVVWDGRGASGRLEPDGIYQFSISATDEAGNYGQSNVVSFVLDTQHKRLLLSTNYTAFSPKGARDTIRIVPEVKSPKGLDSYRIAIVNTAGDIVGSFQGTGVPTGSFAWNGIGRGGRPVPQGRYRAVMTGKFANGVSTEADTPWFTVVTTLPKIEVTSNYRIFSPNGDGHRDYVTFLQRGSGSASWTGRILDANGRTVLEKRWQGVLPKSFTWNGTDSLGNRVPNGRYTYLLSAVDRAGNRAQAEVAGIVVDNSPTQVYIDAGAAGFSPNGDGVDDTIRLMMVERPASGISLWQAEVVGGGRVVRTWSGHGTPPSSPLIWNGSTASGVAPDGEYHAALVVHYRNGAIDHSATAPFLLVTTAPRVRVALSPLPFRPRARHGRQQLSIHLSVASLDPIARWRLRIYTPPIEEPFASFSGLGRPPKTLEWNGKSANGARVDPNSVYSFHLTVVDSLGNRSMVTGTIPIGGPPRKGGSQRPPAD